MAEVCDLGSVAQQSHSDGEGTDRAPLRSSGRRWSPTEESGFYHLALSRVCDISAYFVTFDVGGAAMDGGAMDGGAMDRGAMDAGASGEAAARVFLSMNLLIGMS